MAIDAIEESLTRAREILPDRSNDLDALSNFVHALNNYLVVDPAGKKSNLTHENVIAMIQGIELNNTLEIDYGFRILEIDSAIMEKCARVMSVDSNLLLLLTDVMKSLQPSLEAKASDTDIHQSGRKLVR